MDRQHVQKAQTACNLLGMLTCVCTVFNQVSVWLCSAAVRATPLPIIAAVAAAALCRQHP